MLALSGRRLLPYKRGIIHSMEMPSKIVFKDGDHMKIVNADINQLRRSHRRSRTRSPQVNELIAAIDGLGPGKAKAIVLEPGEDPDKARARLIYAAKIAGRRLRVVVEADRILFARGPGRPRKAT